MSRWILILALAACKSAEPDSPDAGLPIGDAAGDAAGEAASPVASGDPFAALARMPAQCSADHWCWRTPTPTGNAYAHVFATAADNVWLVGEHGTVLQWDGAAWHVHHPAVPDDVVPGQYTYGITGLGPRDIWIVIGNAVEHWDGSTWTIAETLPPNGIHAFDNIWEAPTGDVWVTRNDGMVDRKLAGGAFRSLDTGCNCFIGSIWGLAADDFWMSTLPAGVMHYDGHAFSRAYDAPAAVGAFVGVARDDAWVSGADGVMAHWDGAAWTRVPTGLPVGGFIGELAALASNDVWWWWEGPSSATSGFIHWDGSALTTTPVDTSAVGVYLYDGRIIDGRWWLVGGSGALYTRASDTAIKPIIEPNLMAVTDLWGPTDDNLYLATGGEIRHWDGHAITTIHPLTGAYAVAGVHGAAGDELFSAGFVVTADRQHYEVSGEHFDGTRWTRTVLATPLTEDHKFITKIWPLGPGEALAVGERGVAYHYVAGAWNPVATGVTVDFVGLWGADADHVWATGPGGTFLRWDRTNPSVMTPDPSLATKTDLGAISGAGGTLWIAIPPSSVLQRIGDGPWTTIPANVAVGGIFAVDADHVVVASSGQDQLARWNGGKFVTEDTGASRPTPVLYQPPGGTMVAGGLDVLLSHP